VTHERIRAGDGWIQIDEGGSFEHPTERKSGTFVHTSPLRATLRYLVNPALNDAAARPVIEPIIQLAARFGHAWRYRPSAIDIASFVKRPTERFLYVLESLAVCRAVKVLEGCRYSPTILRHVYAAAPHYVSCFPISRL
jgi:hypothetical protein